MQERNCVNQGALQVSPRGHVLLVFCEIRRVGITSLHQIADALNARGVTMAHDGQWYASSVRNVSERA